MKNLILVCGIFFLFISQAKAQPKAVQEIEKVFAMQQLAWNNGDKETFMQGYWQNDSLIFIGGRAITYGWQKTLDNYKLNYPDKEAMGRLTFTNLKYERISRNHYFVVGKWHLQRKADELGGHYSLIFKKIKGAWKIIADHSS